MGMTAAVLILLAVSVQIMSLVDARLRRREAEKMAAMTTTAPRVVEPAPDVAETSETPSSDGRARAAAIAVAIALAQRSETPAGQVGQASSASAASQSVSDTWLSEGRSRQRSARSARQDGRGWR